MEARLVFILISYFCCMNRKLIPALIILSIIFSSCHTSNKFMAGGFIQKRRYCKGYNLRLGNSNERFAVNHKSKINSPEIFEEKKESKVNIYTVQAPLEMTKTEAGSGNSIPNIKATEFENANPIIYQTARIFIQENDTSTKKNEKLPGDGKPVNPKSVFGFILAMLAFIFLYYSLFPVVLNTALTLFFIGIALAIIAIVFSIIGIHEIERKYPDKYSGTVLSIFGIVISILDLLFSFVLMIVILFWMALGYYH